MKRLIKKAFSELTLSKTPINWDEVTVRRVMSFLFKKKAYQRFSKLSLKMIRYIVRKLFGINLFSDDGYKQWQLLNKPTSSDLKEYAKIASQFSYQPLISIIIPVYNTNLKFLKACIGSVFKQVYTNWELCISDDYSSKQEIIAYLKDISGSSDNIKINFRTENGHISANTNDALAMANGEFVALIDHDDLLAPEALFEIVKCLNDDKTTDLFYSDEDKVDARGRFGSPYFKPGWSPESLLSRNYITHLSVFRKSIIDQIGGMRIGYEGSQDYDLLLRFSEHTQNIKHIPKILYHWRMHSESTAAEDNVKPYAYIAGVKALQDALNRRNIQGDVKLLNGLPGIYSVRPFLKHNFKISIIIPTKDKTDILKTCIESILDKSTYSNYEIVVVDNQSSEPEFHKLIEDYKNKLGKNFHCIRLSIPFNFSALINAGVKRCTGDYLLLLNNDMEIISPDWMESMLQFAQLDEIGAVGAKLIYPNDTIQHAGTVIGLGGVAGHTFIGIDRKGEGYYYTLKCINNYSAVTAAALLVKKTKFNQVNGFREELAVEYNDVDFCLKLIDAGYRNVCLPHVELYHHESLTRGHPHATEESYAQHLHDVKFFKEHWQHFIYNDPYYSPNLTLDNTHFTIRA